MIVDLRNKKNLQIIQMYKTKEEIEDKIEKLEQPYKNILYYRYIKGLDLTKVANEINYNYTYTCELHGTALQIYKNLQP